MCVCVCNSITWYKRVHFVVVWVFRHQKKKICSSTNFIYKRKMLIYNINFWILLRWINAICTFLQSKYIIKVVFLLVYDVVKSVNFICNVIFYVFHTVLVKIWIKFSRKITFYDYFLQKKRHFWELNH